MRIPRYKKDTMLYIEWDDIVQKSEWLKEKKASTTKAAVCKTVGFVLNTDETNLRLLAPQQGKL